jgi:hypothetical protein
MSLRRWFQLLTTFLNLNGVPEESAVDVATSYLTGPALAHWQCAAGEGHHSFAEFKVLLFQRFDLVDPSIHARRMLTDLKQGERSALDHVRTFEYWCSHVVDQSEGEKVHMFLHSLNPRSQRACSVNPLTQRQWDNFAEASRCFLSNAMAASPSAALTEMAPFEPVAAAHARRIVGGNATDLAGVDRGRVGPDLATQRRQTEVDLAADDARP